MAAVNQQKQNDLTATRLRELVAYDVETGIFTARVDRGLKIKAGAVLGNTSHHAGYRTVRVDYARFLAHRLACLYVHGEWPCGEIDHIDGDKDNNRIGNLRVVTRQQNRWNSPLRARKGGVLRNLRFKGPSTILVSFSKGSTRVFNKSFPTLCAALKERNRRAVELYGEFLRAPATKET